MPCVPRRSPKSLLILRNDRVNFIALQRLGIHSYMKVQRGSPSTVGLVDAPRYNLLCGKRDIRRRNLMTQEASYNLDQFIADIRQVFASNQDARAQAQGVAKHMKELLAAPGWLEKKANLKPETGSNRVDLYVDDEYGHPGPGFLVMCALQTPSTSSGLGGVTPHDHGPSWVVYGVCQGAIEQTRFRWAHPDGDRTSPVLQEADQFVQKAGEVAFFMPGEIHHTRTAGEDAALILRVEGQRLDKVIRHRYDPASSSAIAIPATV